MAKRKKLHHFSYEAGSLADVGIEGGKVVAKGLGKLGSFVKRRTAEKHLPEDLLRLKTIIEEFRPARTFSREIRYQDELYGYLMGRLGQRITIEKQLGRSRPDIVVGEM